MWKITYEETNLVGRHRGTLPVILGCPHNGEKSPAGVPVRSGSDPGCPPIRINGDGHTREITTGVAQRLLDIFGEAPYVVIAEFHRKYIDANRPDRARNCAYEVPDAQQYYDEYHDNPSQLRERDPCRKRWAGPTLRHPRDSGDRR